VGKPFALILALVVFPVVIIAQDQVSVKTGIKAGFEFADYFSFHSGSFTKEPGSIFGLFTGIALHRDSEGLVILGIELNYVKLLYYRNNQSIFYNDYTPYPPIQYDGVFDEKLSNQFVEIYLPLEFCWPIFNNDIAMAIYAGPAIGLGDENMEVRETSRTLVDTLKYPGEYNPDPENTPYSYPGGRNTCVPTSFVIGASLSYEFLTVDLRYKRTFNISNPNNALFLQLGLAY